MSVKKLLSSYVEIMDKLLALGVVRTYNNPVSDYAEWLIHKNLNLSLATNSQKGYDAIDKKNNVKYQIKSRRNSHNKTINQLGVIRNLKDNDFDYLIAIIFNHDFSINKIWKMPKKIIKKYSKFSKHQNGYILRLNSEILQDKLTEDITKHIKKPN